MDVKTTGPDERRDMLLQVSFSLTRDDGNSVMGDRVIYAYPKFDVDTFIEAYNLTGEVAKDRYARNGLWDLLTSGSSVDDADISEYRSYPEMDMGMHDLIREALHDDYREEGLALGGADVGVCAGFLREFLPSTYRLFDGGTVDVATLETAFAGYEDLREKTAWKFTKLRDILGDLAEYRAARGWMMNHDDDGSEN
jgi:hypothetical protein